MKQFIRIIPLFLLSALPGSGILPSYDYTKAPRSFIELHVHGEATMTPQTVLQTAKKNHTTLPVNTFEFQKTYRYPDFSIFNAGYSGMCSSLKTDDDMAQILLDYAKASAQKGRMYVEMMFCPSLIEKQLPDMNWQTALKKVNAAAKEAEQQYGIIVTPLLTLSRGDSAELCEKYTQFLVENCKTDLDTFGGIHLSGDEARYSDVTPYMKSYDMVYKAGLGCAAHAGENGGPENILAALKLPGLTRIGHGIACIENQECVDALQEESTLLELCVSSNVCLGVRGISSFQNHPLEKILDTEIRYHITNSDDPTLFNTSPDNELRIIQENFDVPSDAFVQSDLNALQGAFLPAIREHKRSEISNAIWAYYSQEKSVEPEVKTKSLKSVLTFGYWS